MLVPMHNEEKVVAGSFEALRRCEYPRDKFEVIAVNDHSSDKTKDIVDFYIERSKNEPGQWPTLTALHRYKGSEGVREFEGAGDRPPAVQAKRSTAVG